MNISLDISLYPLTPDYKKPILAFIEALRTYEGIEILMNPLSTQLYGDFNLVWGRFDRFTDKIQDPRRLSFSLAFYPFVRR